MPHCPADHPLATLDSFALATILLLISIGIPINEALPYKELIPPLWKKPSQHEKPSYDSETFLKLNSLNLTGKGGPPSVEQYDRYYVKPSAHVMNLKIGIPFLRTAPHHSLEEQFLGTAHMEKPTDYSPSGYITEMVPEDTENLKLDQWIYFRICTTPVIKEKRKVPISFDSVIMEELMKTSCLPRDIERSPFSTQAHLVISVQGRDSIVFDLDNKLLHFNTLEFDSTTAKFWSTESKSIIMFGLRPSHQLDHRLVELFLEHRPDTMNNKKPHAKELNPFDARKEKQLTYHYYFGQGVKVENNFRRNNFGAEGLEKIALLKRFIIRFTDQPQRLKLWCNKTRPTMIFDRNQLSPNGHAFSAIGSTDETSSVYTPAQIDEPGVIKVVDAPVVKHESKEARLLQSHNSNALDHELYGPSPLMFDTENPDPLSTGEILDESAVSSAYKRLQPAVVNPTFPYGHLSADQLLIVPTEPIPGTLTYVVKVGEAINITCQGEVNDNSLKLIFDRDIWNNGSLKQLYSTQTPMGSKLSVILKAKTITWENVSKEPIDDALRFPDQLTEVKCGLHRHIQFWKSDFFKADLPVPVANLYFTIVSSSDYTLINAWLEKKRNQAFDHNSTQTSLKQTPSVPKVVGRIMFTVSNPNKTHSIGVGFWNISLSKLSVMKLTTCLVLGILIVSFIVLLICQYSSVRPHTDSCRTILADESIATWDSGDHQVVSQPIDLRRSWYQILMNIFKRHNNNNNRETTNGSIELLATDTQHNRFQVRKPLGTGNHGALPQDLCRTRYRP